MEDTPQTVYEKQVTVVAYSLDEDVNMSIREWAEKITGVDCTSFEYEEDVEYEIVFKDPETDEEAYSTTVSPWSSAEKKSIKEASDRMSSEDLNVEIKEKVEKKKAWENHTRSAARKLTGELLDGMQQELSGGLSLNEGRDRAWFHIDEDGDVDLDWYVKLRFDNFDRQRVLSKEENRESDDLYETLAERPCYTVRVDMRAPKSIRIDEWTDIVIPDLVRQLSRTPEVGKVRFMDCKKTTQQEGECYSL